MNRLPDDLYGRIVMLGRIAVPSTKRQHAAREALHAALVSEDKNALHAALLEVSTAFRVNVNGDLIDKDVNILSAPAEALAWDVWNWHQLEVP
jgi:hypothetical protein